VPDNDIACEIRLERGSRCGCASSTTIKVRLSGWPTSASRISWSTPRWLD